MGRRSTVWSPKRKSLSREEAILPTATMLCPWCLGRLGRLFQLKMRKAGSRLKERRTRKDQTGGVKASSFNLVPDRSHMCVVTISAALSRSFRVNLVR